MRPSEQKSPPPVGHTERSAVMHINEEPGNATVPRCTVANNKGQNRQPLQRVANLKTLSHELRVQVMEMRKLKKDSLSSINSRALWHNIGGTYRCNRCQLFFFALKRLEEHFRKTHKMLLTWKMLNKCRISGPEPKRSRTKTECSTPSACTTESSESVPRMPNVKGNSADMPLHVGQNSQIEQREIESDDDVIEIPIVHTCQQKKPSTSTSMDDKTTQCQTDSRKQSKEISCSSGVDIHISNTDSQSIIKFVTKSSPKEMYSHTEGNSTSTEMEIKPPVCQQPESLQKVHNSENNWPNTSALRSSSCKGSQDPVPTVDELRLISEARTNRVNVSLTNQHFIYCKYCLDMFKCRKYLKRHRFYECIVYKKRPLSPSCKQIHRTCKKLKFSDKFSKVFELKKDIQLHPRLLSIDRIDADIQVQEEQTLTSHLTSKSFTTKQTMPSKRKDKPQFSCKQNSTSQQLASNKSLASKTSKHNLGLSAKENNLDTLSNQSSSTDEKAWSSVKKCSSTSQILSTKKSHSTTQSSKLSVAPIKDQKICEISHTLKPSSTQSTAKYKTKYMVPSKDLSSKDEMSIVGNQEPCLKSVTLSKSTKHVKPPQRDANVSKSTIHNQQESSLLSSIETKRRLKFKIKFNRKKDKTNAVSSSSQDSHFLLSTVNKKRRSPKQSKQLTKKLRSSRSNYLASCDSATIKNATKRKRSDEHENKIPTSKQKLSQLDLKTSNIEQIMPDPDSKRQGAEPVSASNKPYQLETRRKINESGEVSVKNHDASAYVKKPLAKLSKKSTLSGGNKQQSCNGTTFEKVENELVSKVTEECLVKCNSSLDLTKTLPCGKVLMQENNQLSVNYSGRSKNMHDHANNTKELLRQDHNNIKTSVWADIDAANVDEKLPRHKNNIISQLQNQTSMPKIPKSKIYSYIDSVVEQLKIPIRDVVPKSTSIKDKQRVAEESKVLPFVLPTAIDSSLATSVEEAQEKMKIIKVPKEMTGNEQIVTGEPEVMLTKIGTCLTSLIEEAVGEELENGQPEKIIDVSGEMTLNNQGIPEDLEAVAKGLASGLTSLIEEAQEDGRISKQHLKSNEVPEEIAQNDNVVAASTKTSTKCCTDVCFDKPGKQNIINAPVDCTYSSPSCQRVNSNVGDCGIVRMKSAKHTQSKSESKVEYRGKCHEQGDTILDSSFKEVKIVVENESDGSHCLDEVDSDVSCEKDIYPISVVQAKSAFNLKQARVKFSKILKKVSNESLQEDVNNHPPTLSRESENGHIDQKDEASVGHLVINLDARETEKHVDLPASGKHKLCDDNPQTFSGENTLHTTDSKASENNEVISLDANTTKDLDTDSDMSTLKIVGNPQLAAREVSGQNVCDLTQPPNLFDVGSLTGDHDQGIDQMVVAIEVATTQIKSNSSTSDINAAQLELETAVNKSNSCVSNVAATELQPGEANLERHTEMSRRYLADTLMPFLQNLKSSIQPCSEQRAASQSPLQSSSSQVDFIRMKKIHKERQERENQKRQVSRKNTGETFTPSPVTIKCSNKSLYSHNKTSGSDVLPNGKGSLSKTVSAQIMTYKCSECLQEFSNLAKMYSSQHSCRYQGHSKVISTIKTNDNHPSTSTSNSSHKKRESVPQSGHDNRQQSHHPNSSKKRRRSSFPSISIVSKRHDIQQQKNNRIVSVLALGSTNSTHHASDRSREEQQDLSLAISTHSQTSLKATSQKSKCNEETNGSVFQYFSSLTSSSSVECPVETHEPIGLYAIPSPATQRTVANKTNRNKKNFDTQEPIDMISLPSPATPESDLNKVLSQPSLTPKPNGNKQNKVENSDPTRNQLQNQTSLPSPAPHDLDQNKRLSQSSLVPNGSNQNKVGNSDPTENQLLHQTILPTSASHELATNKVLSQLSPVPNGNNQNKVVNSDPTRNQMQRQTSQPSPALHDSDLNKVLSQSSSVPNRNQNKVENSTVVSQQPVPSKDLKGPGKATANNKPDNIEQITEGKNKTDEVDQIGGLEMTCEDESDLSLGLSINSCHLPSWINNSMSEIVASPHPPCDAQIVTVIPTREMSPAKPPTPEMTATKLSSTSISVDDTCVISSAKQSVPETSLETPLPPTVISSQEISMQPSDTVAQLQSLAGQSQTNHSSVRDYGSGCISGNAGKLDIESLDPEIVLTKLASLSCGNTQDINDEIKNTARKIMFNIKHLKILKKQSLLKNPKSNKSEVQTSEAAGANSSSEAIAKLGHHNEKLSTAATLKNRRRSLNETRAPDHHRSAPDSQVQSSIEKIVNTRGQQSVPTQSESAQSNKELHPVLHAYHYDHGSGYEYPHMSTNADSVNWGHPPPQYTNSYLANIVLRQKQQRYQSQQKRVSVQQQVLQQKDQHKNQVQCQQEQEHAQIQQQAQRQQSQQLQQAQIQQSKQQYIQAKIYQANLQQTQQIYHTQPTFGQQREVHRQAQQQQIAQRGDLAQQKQAQAQRRELAMQQQEAQRRELAQQQQEAQRREFAWQQHDAQRQAQQQVAQRWKLVSHQLEAQRLAHKLKQVAQRRRELARQQQEAQRCELARQQQEAQRCELARQQQEAQRRELTQQQQEAQRQAQQHQVAQRLEFEQQQQISQRKHAQQQAQQQQQQKSQRLLQTQSEQYIGHPYLEQDEANHNTPTSENSHQNIFTQAVLQQQNPGAYQSKKQRTQSCEDQCELKQQTDSTQRDMSLMQTECERGHQSIVHSTQLDTKTISISRGPSPASEQQGQARTVLSGLDVCRLYFQQFKHKYQTTSIAEEIKALKLRYVQLEKQYKQSKTLLTKYATDLLVTVLVKDIRKLALNIKYAAVEKLLQNVDPSSQEAMQLDKKKKEISETLIQDKLIKLRTEAQHAYIQSSRVELRAILGTQKEHVNSNAVVAWAQKYPHLSQLLRPVSQQTTEDTSCETLEIQSSAPVNIKQEPKEQNAPTVSVNDLHVGNHTPTFDFLANEPLASGNRQTKIDGETQVAPDCRLQESPTIDHYSSESSQLNQHNKFATTDIQLPNVVNGPTASNEPLFMHSTNSSSSNVLQSEDIFGKTTFEQHSVNRNSKQHNEHIRNDNHHLAATSAGENVASRDCQTDSLCTSTRTLETSIINCHFGLSTSNEHREPATTDVQNLAVDNMTPKDSQFIVLDRTKESEQHSDNITDDALPEICKETAAISQQILEKNTFRHEPNGAWNELQTEEALVGEQLSSSAALVATSPQSIVENTLGPEPTAVCNDLQTEGAPLGEQLPCGEATAQCLDLPAIVSQQCVNKDTLITALHSDFNDYQTEEVLMNVADSTKDHLDVVTVRRPDVNLFEESHKDTTEFVDVQALHEELDSQSGLSLEKQSKFAKEHLDSAQVMPPDCRLTAQAEHPSESAPARDLVEQPTLSLSATRSDAGRVKVPEAEKSITDLQASQSVQMQCLAELSKGNQVQVPTPEDSAAEQQDSPSEESHSSEEILAKKSTSPDLIDQRKMPKQVQGSHTSLQTESSGYTADLKKVQEQSRMTPKRPTRPQPDVLVTQPVSPVPTPTASDSLLSAIAIQPALPNESTLSRLIVPTAASSLSPVEVRPYRMREKAQRKGGLSEHAKDTQLDTEGYFMDSDLRIQSDKRRISADTVRASEVVPLIAEKSNVQMQTKVFEYNACGSDSDSDIDVVSVTPTKRSIDGTSEATGNRPLNPKIIDVNNKVAENILTHVSRGHSASIPHCSSQTVAQTSPTRQPSEVSSLHNSVLPPQTPVVQAVPDGNTRQDLLLNRQCPQSWKTNSWRTPQSVFQTSVMHQQQDSSISKQSQQHALKAGEGCSTSGSTLTILKASSWNAALFGSQTSARQNNFSKNQVHDTGATQGQSTVMPSSSSQSTFSDKLYPTSNLKSSGSQHSLIWAPNNWCTPACAAQTSFTNTTHHTGNISRSQDILNPVPATLVTETRPVAEVTPQSRTSPLQNRTSPQDEILPVIISVQSLHPDVWKNKVNDKE